MSTYQWPYQNEIGQEEEASCDVLVLGGGLAGCYAAIAAARKREEGNRGGKRGNRAQRRGGKRL